MGKSYQTVKSQYVYVNSVNRSPTDPGAYKFTLKIPDKIFSCENPSMFFKLSVQDWNCIASWYFVNNTNNQFIIRYTPSAAMGVFTIPVGNYQFSKLASKVQELIQASGTIPNSAGITVTYDKTLNKLIFNFPSNDYKLSDIGYVSTSAFGIFGLNKGSEYSGLSIVSLYPLVGVLSDNLVLCVENLTPSDKNVSVENANSFECVPSKTLMSICNNFGYNDFVTFQSQNDAFALYVKERNINEITFSIKDENNNLLTFISEWRCSLKIETLQEDDQYNNNNEIIGALHEIRDYLKYIFVGKHLSQ